MNKVISTIAVGVSLMGAVSFAQNDTSSYSQPGTAGSANDVNTTQPGVNSTPGKTMEQKMDNPTDTSVEKTETSTTKKKSKQHKRPSSDLKQDSNKNINNSTESNP